MNVMHELAKGGMGGITSHDLHFVFVRSDGEEHGTPHICPSPDGANGSTWVSLRL
jgi:hypothetical protein